MSPVPEAISSGRTLETTHTKERPYRCSCGLSFTRRDLLKRHLTISRHSASQPEDIHRQPADGGLIPEVGNPPSKEVGQIPGGTARRIEDLSSPAFFEEAGNASEVLSRSPSIPTDANPNLPYDFALEVVSGRDEGAPLDMINDPSLAELAHMWEMPNTQSELETTAWRSDLNPGYEVCPRLSEFAQRRDPPGADLSVESSFRQGMEASVPSAATRDLVTQHVHQTLQNMLAEYRSVLHGFDLPSQFRLNRYVKSYFDGWTQHLAFVHEPTLDLEESSIDFVLALASLGAQWCLEQRNALNLYLASMAILRRRAMIDNQFPSTARLGQKLEFTPKKAYNLLSTAVILLGYASWESPTASSDISTLVCITTPCIEMVGLTECAAAGTTWLHWVEQESRRRLCLVAFVLLETLSVAYNLPPALFGSRIGLQLPCESRLWHATSAEDWARLRATPGSRDQPLYRDALSSMLQWHTARRRLDFEMTAEGGYVLMHGLLQRIHLLREVSAPLISHESDLPGAEIDRLKGALNIWSMLWDRSSRSNSDLGSFISCTLLALAHIRIHIDFSPYERLASRDPTLIAVSLLRCPPIPSTPSIISALAYATSALSFTIGIGIDSLAKNYKYTSAIRHALAGFESAIFLSKWLMSLHEARERDHLTEHENSILHRIKQNLTEAYNSVNNPEDMFVWTQTRSPSDWNGKQMALATLAVWGRVLKHDSPWSILGVMGASLDQYASRLADPDSFIT
ncbi:hypothetical protein AbraIFM66951_005861 [Aspergillus brasiliensis]|uniref:C2H2-type domain-containing protein n=1 Tax=Aspergillus brasiliensis TaxID=319629 RepID=A0A9W5YR63_9EURO|nr:hypothetical protein AbraCBS73388_006114 [Aspergillus brasiliensis]GKZ44085.1 hypothetical protein AbraIFM66951_005861 [Aspergillus brasiliensis]